MDKAGRSSRGFQSNTAWVFLVILATVGCEREDPPTTQRSLADQPPVEPAASHASARPADEQDFVVPDQQFANLQILPEAITRDVLISEMRLISQSLGVRCNTCHLTAESDYASDAKAAKRMARRMMEMVERLNAEAFTWPNAPRATCYMCHRGELKPSTEFKVIEHAFRGAAASNRNDRSAPRRADAR